MTVTYESSMQPSLSFFNTHILAYIELSLRQIKTQHGLTNNMVPVDYTKVCILPLKVMRLYECTKHAYLHDRYKRRFLKAKEHTTFLSGILKHEG